MKSKFRLANKLLASGLYVLLVSTAQAQVQWPVTVSSGQQPKIIGVVGEYRSGSDDSPLGRFHRGTDMIGNGTLVHPIRDGRMTNVSPAQKKDESGGAYARRQRINIGGILYYHTEPLASVLPKAQWPTLNAGKLVPPVSVTAGIAMGEMITASGWGTHVHIQDGALTNYLINGFGFTGFQYVDNADPVFEPIDNIRFYKDPLKIDSPISQKLDRLFPFTDVDGTVKASIEVYGKVDIAARVGDYRTGPTGNAVDIADNRIGLYKLSYELSRVLPAFTYERQQVYEFSTAIMNNKTYAPLVFAPGTTEAKPIWTVTNRRNGGTVDDDNWDTKKVTTEPQYPDGFYRVQVRGEDVRQRRIDKEMIAWVNNHRGYVSQVRASVGQTIVYSKTWKLDPISQAIMLDGSGVSQNVPSGSKIRVEVFTSEQMRSLQVAFEGKTYSPDLSKSADGVLWIFELDMPDLTKSPQAEKPLTFTGRNFDSSELLLLVRADTRKDIGRNKDGTFASGAGTDTYHFLSFCNNANTTLDLNPGSINETTVRVSVTGGTQPYEYRIGDGQFGANPDFGGLDKNSTYLFSVRDKEGCIKSKDFSFKDGSCNLATASGGQGTDTKFYELGTNSGTVRIQYEMYSIPDQMDVYYNNAPVATTGGLVSGSRILTFPYSPRRGDPTRCQVNMIAPNSGTAWTYTLYCPTDQRPLRVGQPEAAYILDTDNTASGPRFRLNPTAFAIPSTTYTLQWRYVGDTNWTSLDAVIRLPYTFTPPQVGREVELQLLRPNETPLLARFPVRVFPNPGSGRFTVSYEASQPGNATLTVYGLAGQSLLERTWTVEAGPNQTELDLPASATTGQYILRVHQGAAYHTTSLLLTR